MVRANMIAPSTTARSALGPAAAAAKADDPVNLTETSREGRIYHIVTRVDLSGTLTLPAAKGQPAPKPVYKKG